MLVPVMNLFELRPMVCKGKECCIPDDSKEARKEREEGGAAVTCKEMFTLFKVPHGISVILTLAVFFGAIGGCFAVRVPSCLLPGHPHSRHCLSCHTKTAH